MKLSALIEGYLVDCRARRLAPKTIAGFRAFLGYFQDWLLAAGHPDSLRSMTYGTIALVLRRARWTSRPTASTCTYCGGPSAWPRWLTGWA